MEKCKEIWNDEDKKAASKALQLLAVIEALCGGVFPGGNYVDEELLKEVVSDMEDETWRQRT